MRRAPFVVAFAAAQIAAGKAQASPSEPLEKRYSELACAVVQLQAGNETGTGFFINQTGRLVTAAHVSLDRTATSDNGAVRLNIQMKSGLAVISADGSTHAVMPRQLQRTDLDNAEHDLSIIETGLSSPCYLHISLSSELPIGTHLIAIGFPMLASNHVLYDGFLSERHATQHQFGSIDGTQQAVGFQYDVMRVQMPLTPGTSGAPLINDRNEVVGVETEAPSLSIKELNRLISYQAGHSSGVKINGFDSNRLLAELAYMVTTFQSPGAGWGVPISYLHPISQTSASRGH